jgi:hypothetical protein
MARISNVVARRSTDGAIMDAHSGPILRWETPRDDTYWWYASSYNNCTEPPQNVSGCTPWPPPPNGCGFRNDHYVTLFTSADLGTWRNRGAALRMTDMRAQGLPESILYSPIVVFHAPSNTYIMWFNWVVLDFSASYIAIATSPTREGPFTLHTQNVTLAHAATGDFAIFLDSDGAAYVIYTAHIFGPGPAHLMSVEKLAPDFLSSTLQNSGYFGHPGVEGPSLFKRNGVYYASFGGTCCFCREGSDAYIYTSAAPLGPYTLQTKLGGAAPIGAQQSAIFPWKDSGGATQYMWWGARWQTAPDGDKAHDFNFFYPLSFLPDGNVSEMTWVDAFDVDAQ